MATFFFVSTTMVVNKDVYTFGENIRQESIAAARVM